MKMFNLSESQVNLVIKSLRDRLADFEDELEVLESRIKEIVSKRREITEILAGIWSGGGQGVTKKRGRKPGSGGLVKAIEAIEDVIAPKRRGRKPGSKNRKKSETVAESAPKKRGRKPKTVSAVTGSPAVSSKKRGRKIKSEAEAAKGTKSSTRKTKGKNTKTSAKKTSAGKVSAKKTKSAEKSVKAKSSASKKKNTGVKKAAQKATSLKKPAKKVSTKTSGSKAPTLASKIISAIEEAGKGLNTHEITESLIAKYGPADDKRKFMQAISSTLIGMAKRGKIIREEIGNRQFVNKLP